MAGSEILAASPKQVKRIPVQQGTASILTLLELNRSMVNVFFRLR
jgi:hypothetical protein